MTFWQLERYRESELTLQEHRTIHVLDKAEEIVCIFYWTMVFKYKQKVKPTHNQDPVNT